MFAEPYYSRHPAKANSVAAALDLIAADPYLLRLEPYRGDDLPVTGYVFELNATIRIVFGLAGGRHRGWLALLGILDDADTD